MRNRYMNIKELEYENYSTELLLYEYDYHTEIVLSSSRETDVINSLREIYEISNELFYRV